MRIKQFELSQLENEDMKEQIAKLNVEMKRLKQEKENLQFDYDKVNKENQKLQEVATKERQQRHLLRVDQESAHRRCRS